MRGAVVFPSLEVQFLFETCDVAIINFVNQFPHQEVGGGEVGVTKSFTCCILFWGGEVNHLFYLLFPMVRRFGQKHSIIFFRSRISQNHCEKF